MVTLYFNEVDSAGHDYGPDSPQVLEAAHHLDEALGQLVSGVQTLGLQDRTSVVAVSDHGMSPHRASHTIFLDDYVDLSTVDVIDWTPILELAPRSGSPGSIDEVYRALKGTHRALTIYKREEMPARLHYRDNPRIPPIIGLADDGWMITSHKRLADAREKGTKTGGEHGYDPKYRSMHGLFVAAGPRIARHKIVPEFQNIHIYDFLCEILGLTPASNDGDPGVTRTFFTNARDRARFARTAPRVLGALAVSPR